MEHKARLLEVMLSRETYATCVPFQQHWKSIRDDLGLPASKMSGAHCRIAKPLFQRVFYQKMPGGSPGTRLANGIYPNTTFSKWCLPTILAIQNLAAAAAEAKRGGGDQAQMRREFSRLKETLGGGPKLSYYTMSERLWFHCAVVQLCTRAIWTWYSEHVREIKSPADNVQELIRMQSIWAKEPHIQTLAGVPTSRDPMLVRLLAHTSIFDAAEKVSMLSFHLLRKRCGSLSRHSCPPDCYAQLFSEHTDMRQAQWGIFFCEKRISCNSNQLLQPA